MASVGTKKEVAEFFGVTTRAVRYWEAAGMPRRGRLYDLDQIRLWLRGRRLSGKSLQELQNETQVEDLFFLAVQQLRQGLQNLCVAFTKARGKHRQALVDRAVRGILYDAKVQVSLLQGEGEERPK
jgi:DNA-binding transcriptional MerR regulator